MRLPPDPEKILKEVTVSCGPPSRTGAMHDAFSKAVEKARNHFLNGRDLDARNDAGDVIMCSVKQYRDGAVNIRPSRSNDEYIRVDVSRGKGLQVHVLNHLSLNIFLMVLILCRKVNCPSIIFVFMPGKLQT